MRKFELLISDQILEYLLRGNGRFETETPVLHFLSFRISLTLDVFFWLFNFNSWYIYRYFSLKTTISSQQIFQSLVRNKQFKFSRFFWVMTDCKLYPAQLTQLLCLFWFQKHAKIWTAYFWPKIGRSAARKQFFWAWSGCNVNFWKWSKISTII